MVHGLPSDEIDWEHSEIHLFTPERFNGMEITTRIVYAIASIEDRPPESIDLDLPPDLDLEALDRLYSGEINSEIPGGYVVVRVNEYIIYLLANRTMLFSRDRSAKTRSRY